MFVCLSCKAEIVLDDVQIRLTDNPADRRALCVFCAHVDDQRPVHLRPAIQADVTETARKA